MRADNESYAGNEGKIMTAIRKFDPLIHEFENDRAEEKYTRWLTEKVEGVLSGNSQPVPHEDVAARAARRLLQVRCNPCSRSSTGMEWTHWLGHISASRLA